MQIRHFVSNAAVHATRRQGLFGCVTRYAFRLKFRAVIRSCQVHKLSLRYLSQIRTERTQPNADCGSRTDHPQRPGGPLSPRLGARPTANAPQTSINRTSAGHLLKVNTASTERQRNVNATATERQRGVNRTATGHQPDNRFPSRRHVQSLDEARALFPKEIAPEDGLLVHLGACTHSALQHFRVTARDRSRVSHFTRPQMINKRIALRLGAAARIRVCCTCARDHCVAWTHRGTMHHGQEVSCVR